MFGGGGGGGGMMGGMSAGGNPAAGQFGDVNPKSFKLSILKRIYYYLARYPVRLFWTLVLTVARAVLRPSLGFTTAWVVNTAINSGDWPRVLWGTGIFLGLALLTEYVFFWRSRLALNLAESAVHDLRAEYFRHLQTMPMSFYTKTHVGSILSRMISDIENVRRGVQHVFFFAPMLFGMIFIASVFMFIQNATLFLILCGIAPVIGIINKHFNLKMIEASRAVQRSQSRVTGKVAESVRGMRVIQGYVQEEKNLGAYNALVETHAGNNVRLGKSQATYLALLDFNSHSFLALILAIGGYGAVQGWASIRSEDVVAFFFLSNHFFHPLQQLGRLYSMSVMAVAGAERIFSVLDEEPEWQDAPNAPALPAGPGAIHIDNVSFAYLPGKPVLEDIQLEIPAGATVALVGSTGSGKSTLINLIAKLFLPTAGTIRIDGHDLRDCDTASWRSRISVVPQRNFLFSGTVLDNIRLSKTDATEDDIIRAARDLDCMEIIQSLPEGLSTQVGENGHSLSMGTRQIICFIRAWLSNPSLLILDEATSAIDTLTEARVQRALTRLLENRTSIIIAHRLSTVKNADLICVMDKGKIVERGSHRELIQARGAYSRLYEQFASTAMV